MLFCKIDEKIVTLGSNDKLLFSAINYQVLHFNVKFFLLQTFFLQETIGIVNPFLRQPFPLDFQSHSDTKALGLN